MFRKTIRALLPTILALTVVAGALPASAAPKKDHEMFKDEGIFTMEDMDCGDFWLTEEMVSEKVKVTHYYDKAGNETKSVTKADFHGVVTNSASGNTFTDRANFVETVDFVAGTTTVSGVSYLFVVDGEVVFAEAGFKVLDTDTGEVLYQIGPNDYEEYGLEMLCDVLL